MARKKADDALQTDEALDQQDTIYVCVAKCFFNSMLWKQGEITGYISGIETSPYFTEQ
jgi:hypothetical protein